MFDKCDGAVPSGERLQDKSWCGRQDDKDGETETFVSSGGDFGFYFINTVGEFWGNLTYTLIVNKL